ncbi:MAG: site-2 protease family protein [Candidatus Methanofastidiosia archaeon]
MKFSKKEVQDLIVAWFVLTVILSRFEASLLLASFVAVGTAFICHELAHKFTAQKYNLFAEFRMWKQGMMMAILIAILSRGHFIFAAPGAVYIYGFHVSQQQNGKISLAGPLLNLIIATSTLLAMKMFSPSTLLISVAVINGYLGFFNLLPIPPLDGSKILKWNTTAYATAIMWSFALIALIEFWIF